MSEKFMGFFPTPEFLKLFSRIQRTTYLFEAIELKNEIAATTKLSAPAKKHLDLSIRHKIRALSKCNAILGSATRVAAYKAEIAEAKTGEELETILHFASKNQELTQCDQDCLAQCAKDRIKELLDAQRQEAMKEAAALKEDRTIFAFKAIAKQIAECTHHDELLAVLSAIRQDDRFDFQQHQELIRHCHAKMATLASERADAPVDVSAITKELLR